MKSPENLKLIKDWLSLARENLLFARAGMKEDFSPYHSICYMCQGSAEKYLKAFLLWNDWQLKKTHDMSELLDYCYEYNNSFERLFPECEMLNEYVIEGRYPGDLPFESIGEGDAKKAIEAAEKIEKHVLKNINLLSDENSTN
jgi:HEPN domain-containing protein